MNSIKQIVAKNLTELRKANNLTQAELAAKLNYSDKSVSKWEHAESLPDIEVLCSLAELYGVTVDYLTHEGSYEDKIAYVKKDKERGNKIAIAGLMVIAVWFIAATIYVYVMLNTHLSVWTVFLWSVPLSAFVLLIFNRKWGGNKLFGYVLTSLFLWGVLFSLCFQFIDYNIWAILIIGLPIQIAIILISRIKK